MKNPPQEVVLKFKKYNHGFKFSKVYPNRVYFYQRNYNLDFADLPSGRWQIVKNEVKKTLRFITFKKIE